MNNKWKVKDKNGQFDSLFFIRIYEIELNLHLKRIASDFSVF